MSEQKEMSAREQAIKAINEGNSVFVPVKDFPEGKQFTGTNTELPSLIALIACSLALIFFLFTHFLISSLSLDKLLYNRAKSASPPN